MAAFGALHKGVGRREDGSNSRSEALVRKPRKSGQRLRHWTFKGWTAPSPFLAEMDEFSHNRAPDGCWAPRRRFSTF